MLGKVTVWRGNTHGHGMISRITSTRIFYNILECSGKLRDFSSYLYSRGDTAVYKTVQSEGWHTGSTYRPASQLSWRPPTGKLVIFLLIYILEEIPRCTKPRKARDDIQTAHTVLHLNWAGVLQPISLRKEILHAAVPLALVQCLTASQALTQYATSPLAQAAINSHGALSKIW
jgi:hypothetical protein